MKNLVNLFAVAAALAVASTTTGLAGTAEPGSAAPDFTLTDIDGKTHKLSDYKGKTVVLEWVNPECPFVVRHYQGSGNMPSLQKEATQDGVVWLTINSGKSGAQGDFEPAKVKSWIQETKAAPTAYIRDQDGKVGKLYGAKTTPHMYVIDPNGKLVYAGGIDDNRKTHVGATNYVKAALGAIKGGKPVEKASAEPYGCSVKY